MRDGGAIRRLLARALDIDMNPLMVAADLGELVDHVLGHLDSVAGRQILALKAVEAEKSTRTLQKLLDAYVAHLQTQGRRSHVDANQIFKSHVTAVWPAMADAPAVDLTPDQVLDMLRRLIEAGKGRIANKLRSYLRAAYQCALDVRTTASIPVVFKVFGVLFNPAAQTRHVASSVCSRCLA